MGRTFGRQVEAIDYVHDDGRPYRHKFGKGSHMVANDDGTVLIRSTRGRSWDKFRQVDGSVKTYLVNAQGNRVTRRRRKTTMAKRRKAARKGATKKRRTIPAHVRRAGGWAAYMASIRPGGKTKMARRRRRKAKRSSGVTRRRRRRRNPVQLAASPRRRRRRSVYRAPVRRRRRRNPFGIAAGGGGIVKQTIGLVVQGAKDGAVGTVAVGLARFGRGMLRQEGNTVKGIVTELGLGVIQAMVARRIFGGDVARAAMQGVTQGIITTAVKGANVPYLSPALGDEGELPLLSGIYDIGDVMAGDTLPLLAGVNELGGVSDFSGVGAVEEM